MKNQEQIIKELMNNLHKATLKIPILKGYEIDEKQKQALMVAKAKDHSVEQYLEDGKLNENETVQDRIKKVITEAEQEMQKMGLKESKITFLEEFKSDILQFYLYLQDNITENKQIRQINAYFIEPESKYFYQITLATPPMLKTDINDIVTNNILTKIKFILKNIQYN